MQVYAWMGFHLLIFGNWLLKCFILPLTNERNPKAEYRETCCVTHHLTSTPKTKPNKISVQHDTLELSNVDYVSSNAKSSQFGAMLWIFEDNEAVIKMIIRSRSPTMRRVSRTRRVALEWLFDRINLDPKIQIKYVDTKHQLADMLTPGNFTRDEWNNLLLLCNISHFSSSCSSSCPETMAKRMQEERKEKRGLWHSPRRRGAQRLHACRRKI